MYIEEDGFAFGFISIRVHIVRNDGLKFSHFPCIRYMLRLLYVSVYDVVYIFSHSVYVYFYKWIHSSCPGEHVEELLFV